jgi:hypothetical protein
MCEGHPWKWCDFRKEWEQPQVSWGTMTLQSGKEDLKESLSLILGDPPPSSDLQAGGQLPSR